VAGKPVLDAGIQASQQYFELGPDPGTASDVTPEGDLWSHGGWIRSSRACSCSGCGIRVLDDMTDVAGGRTGVLVSLLFPAIVQAGDDWSGLLAGIRG